MTEVLIACLILFIVIGLLARFFDRYAAFWYRIMVTDQLELIHFILASEEVPLKWRIGWIESRAGENNLSAFWRIMNRLLSKWYVFRLDRLIIAVHNSSFIKKQEKAEYLEGLKEIRDAWEEIYGVQ